MSVGGHTRASVLIGLLILPLGGLAALFLGSDPAPNETRRPAQRESDSTTEDRSDPERDDSREASMSSRTPEPLRPTTIKTGSSSSTATQSPLPSVVATSRPDSESPRGVPASTDSPAAAESGNKPTREQIWREALLSKSADDRIRTIRDINGTAPGDTEATNMMRAHYSKEPEVDIRCEMIPMLASRFAVHDLGPLLDELWDFETTPRNRKVIATFLPTLASKDRSGAHQRLATWSADEKEADVQLFLGRLSGAFP